MKILKIDNFIAEQTNAVGKPNNNPQNIEEFKYWLTYYKYDFELLETDWGGGKGQKIAVKDKLRPQYTIYFDFYGSEPNACEFAYHIEKEGMDDLWYDPSSTYEIDRIQDIGDRVDVKKSYKYVVNFRKKQLERAERAYKKALKKSLTSDESTFSSRYEVEKEEEKLERIMRKYNSI